MAEVLSGQITVAAAGTAVQGTDVDGVCFRIKALAGNSGFIYIGNDSANDVTASNGYELDAGEWVEIEGPLGAYWFDTSSNGDKACWIRLK